MFKLPDNLESKYRFVTLASLRAEQLQAGARPRIETPTRKATVVAQEEVAMGLVEPWDPSQPAPEAEEAVVAEE
jgi:DNA-directed RNA polymerase omega subunit